jgi:5,10-methenyltetrahydrofolate synthetase
MIWREKQILREKMKAAIRNAAGKALASQLIRRHLQNSAIWERAQVVFGFVAHPREPDWLGDYSPGEKLIAFPRIGEEGTLSFHCGTAFEVGALGVKQPADGAVAPSPDLVIVPGLAFDCRGGRLGRGRGFYDRWLKANPTVKALGVCFKCQIVESVPTEPHDARVGVILTEEGFILP